MISELRREKQAERRTRDDETEILVVSTNAREGVNGESYVFLAFKAVDREESRSFAAKWTGSVGPSLEHRAERRT